MKYTLNTSRLGMLIALGVTLTALYLVAAFGFYQESERAKYDVHIQPGVVSYEYAPTMEDLARATVDLTAALEQVPDKAKNKLLVAADEIFANIVRYSGATHWSMSVVRTHHPEGVRLVLSDDGKPFDPLAQRDPDTTLSAAEREIGGLGILIVKKTMSPVTYRRRNGNNILTMGKDYGNQINN